MLGRKAPWLSGFASGQHRWLGYGGCHLSSPSVTEKGGPDRATGALGMAEKQLAGLVGLREEGECRGRKEAGREAGSIPQTPAAAALPLHGGLKFA